MNDKRRICVATGSRADYGLLYWLLWELQRDRDVELLIVATGAHLSPSFGHTVDEIRRDGFDVACEIEMLLAGDSPVAVAKSMGLGVIGFADAFAALRPDILCLLGDRFEMLAAAQAAMVARIPIAHIHGGEATEGLIDEAIRHCLTKMSHLHFCAAEAYRRRIVQMGEDPSRVWNVGAAGIDQIARQASVPLKEIEQFLGISLRDGPVFLITYHPVTLQPGGDVDGMRALLSALHSFPSARLVFTGTNADTHGAGIAALVDAFVAAHSDRAVACQSLGRVRYTSLLRYAALVVGNSSSGIIEAPSVGTPTVNIGPRQDGRLRAPSVLDAEPTQAAIAAAVGTALGQTFQEMAAACETPYGVGGAAVRMAERLKVTPLENILIKQFHDVCEERS